MARLERLDRKTLKQDALLNFTARAADYVSANPNLVMGITAAVIVAIVLGVFWIRGRSGKTAESDLRVSALVSAYSAGEYAVSLEVANALQTEYPGTRAAVAASFLKGQSLLQLGSFAEAEQSFQSYLAQSSKAPFYEDAAKLGLAASLEGQSRYGEAAGLYLEVAEGLFEPLASEVRLDAARAYRSAGSIAQARSLLEEVESRENESSRRATIELAILEALQGATTSAAASTDSSMNP